MTIYWLIFGWWALATAICAAMTPNDIVTPAQSWHAFLWQTVTGAVCYWCACQLANGL